MPRPRHAADAAPPPADARLGVVPPATARGGSRIAGHIGGRDRVPARTIVSLRAGCPRPRHRVGAARSSWSASPHQTSTGPIDVGEPASPTVGPCAIQSSPSLPCPAERLRTSSSGAPTVAGARGLPRRASADAATLRSVSPTPLRRPSSPERRSSSSARLPTASSSTVDARGSPRPDARDPVLRVNAASAVRSGCSSIGASPPRPRRGHPSLARAAQPSAYGPPLDQPTTAVSVDAVSSVASSSISPRAVGDAASGQPDRTRPYRDDPASIVGSPAAIVGGTSGADRREPGIPWSRNTGFRPRRRHSA